MQFGITIFTPTYNRAYILPKLYQSLINQTEKCFEWLIVDDGSTDSTKHLVESWINDNQISIRYIKQKNSGKMSAHNRGVIETNTELFLCVDSDDWLTRNAVEVIMNCWKSSTKKDDNACCGLIAYKGIDEIEPVGSSFPNDIEVSTLSGLYQRGFYGDTSLIFKTSILKQNPFPIIENEKFITEAYIYDQIDLTYYFELLKDIIVVCQYRLDGLTQNLNRINIENPCGYTAYFIQKGNLASTCYKRFLFYIRANCFRKEIKNVKMPVNVQDLLLYNLAYPLGLLLRIKKKYITRRQ